MDVGTVVHEFIEKNFLVKRGAAGVGRDESLLDSGLIDSLAIFMLVSFLEEQFRVTIEDEDIVPGNFETINQIVAFVTRKQAS